MSDTVEACDGKVPLTVWVDPPPEGMAWKQDARFATGDEVLMVGLRARPIVPATVMVEMLRDDAGWVESQCRPSDLGQAVSDRAVRVANTMRAALARKPEAESRCGYMYSFHGNDWHSNSLLCQRYGCTPCTRPLGHKEPHAEVKPCPVMVCALHGGKSKDCWRKDTHDQRPCKHYEGHGGEHE